MTNKSSLLDRMNLVEHVRTSLKEDGVESDITTKNLPDPTKMVRAEIIAKEPGVICGGQLVKTTFRLATELLPDQSPETMECDFMTRDGSKVQQGESIASIRGPVGPLLSGERLALNYLQQLSGVATRTARIVVKAEPHDVAVYDTRKTVPHHRILQKYAVRCGGGNNHRLTLSESVMIKDTHKTVSGGLGKYLETLSTNKPVIVEIHSREELNELLQYSEKYEDSFDIEIIMLDNFEPDQVSEIIDRSPQSLTFEVSGGVRLENLERYCRTGTDRVSVGALTHSFTSLDLSLKLIP